MGKFSSVLQVDFMASPIIASLETLDLCLVETGNTRTETSPEEMTSYWI